jgi:outer membrane immunogenic protein
MRTRLAALLLLGSACSMQSASAADMPSPVYKAPVPVTYNWSGVYVGGNVGGARQNNCWTFVGFFPNVDEGCHSSNGVTAGGQVGVNLQSGRFVLGLEASGNWADLEGGSVSLGFPIFTNETRTDAIGLFTGRVGAAWDNWLFYAKAGAAVTRNEYRSFVTAAPAVVDSQRATRWGWTAGGGIEFGFAPNWSAAVEYDYVDTGSQTSNITTGLACAPPCTDAISQRIHMGTLRLNYRFAPMH